MFDRAGAESYCLLQFEKQESADRALELDNTFFSGWPGVAVRPSNRRRIQVAFQLKKNAGYLYPQFGEKKSDTAEYTSSKTKKSWQRNSRAIVHPR